MVVFVQVTVNKSRSVPEIYVGIRLKHSSFCLLCVCGGGAHMFRGLGDSSLLP